MLKRIINLQNIFGTIAFLSLLMAPGAVESEMYLTAAALIAGTGISAYLALREDGKIRKENRPCNLATSGSVNNTHNAVSVLRIARRKGKVNKK